MSEVRTDVAGTVWQVHVSVGQRVAEGDELLIVESMKMEIPVLSPINGIVAEIYTAERKLLSAGQLLFAIRE